MRDLSLLSQRINVVKTFALSMVYYVAFVLPMSKNIGNKFEKLLGAFIWGSSGKFLRVSLIDLKLPVERGGLALPCVNLMSKSLLLNQFLL